MTDRPTLVYDDDCGFCTWCARVAVRHCDVDALGFSDLDEPLLARLPSDYERGAHLLADGETYSFGASIERTLARAHPALSALFAGLRRVPGYAALRERLYRWGADRRAWWGRIVRSKSVYGPA
ncbi:DCC1-like thiol-disulfide oxidoreductase family protein [Halomarina ordinaria]|uniref:DCC1-like thiol-disulfide oxidoreductase family protein n=1 Tax=Halomarina ordinaria TaxID=3033939 RepID=A0ABD5UDW7_9EURY|nr:DCC1-like thiol-disulfide oxidoreductase family protein [Halomarina sp. PSRA2]